MAEKQYQIRRQAESVSADLWDKTSNSLADGVLALKDAKKNLKLINPGNLIQTIYYLCLGLVYNILSST